MYLFFYAWYTFFFFFFFFQAEDGIRDHCVTGVQTCALPILTARDVDEVVPGLAVAVHVTRVDERVTVTAVARETVALADLHEDPDPGLETRRPGLGVRGGPDDPMPWAEFGVAQLRFVGVTLHRLVLPQHARDFRRFQVVARVGEAVPDARGQPGCEVLAQLGCDVDGMPVARTSRPGCP